MTGSITERHQLNTHTNGYVLFVKEVWLCSQPLGESLAALTHILINLKHMRREQIFLMIFFVQ